MTTPPRPAKFHPEVPPPGFESKLISFWRDRDVIDPRLQLIHTNGASREGSVDASFNWANQPGSNHTIPHCQIDRDGRAALILPSNRKGIANYKVSQHSLAFETADTGYIDDPTISAFTAVQAEQLAIACAYYNVLHGIPLEYPDRWDGAGTACHTEPFGYPYWTNSNGKICPGDKKKQQMRDLVLPRAREIAAAWTAPSAPAPKPTPEQTPDPDPPTEDDMTAATLWADTRYKNVFLIGAGSVVTCSPDVFDSLRSRGVPFVHERHDQMLRDVCAHLGIDRSDLVSA